MKKVVILGGSFDPVHNGHIEIINETIKNLDLDEGWLMPARYPRWKKGCTCIKSRLELLNKVAKYEKNIFICKEEINSKSINYTYETMLKLIDKNKDCEFYFLIGADQLNLLNKWYEIDKLSKIVRFIVVNRPNYELNKENIIKYNCKLIDYCGPDISSTEFKETLNLNLIPPYLHDNIIQAGDYYKKKLSKMINYKRYCHSLQVAKLSKEIARSNNYDEKKAFLAGLLHDCAKDVDKSIEKEIMNSEFKNYINESPFIYHQFVGSILVKNEFSIFDDEIINAIKWHTTGTSNMSILAKIVYAADKIEPTRGYDSQYMIDACLKDINSGFELVLSENYKFLLKKGFVVKDAEATRKCLEYYKII